MDESTLPLFQSIQPQAQALSVGELTVKIKSSLEGEFREIWVKGEISNYKPASSGHIYFSLKDDQASISCASFGWSRKNKSKIDLKDGLEVLCRGNISVYAPRGNYQLIVESIEPLGVGALQLAFEQLKQKLQAEGLFDAKLKKPLPKYPKKIVVITSTQAAALRDVLTVLKRRAPQVEVLLIPALVQGNEAPAKLIQALKVANRYRLGEVILLTRGGGSIEDLWSFNNEELARTIAQSELPIVSAVGHEIDFTISDFVADLRAPTPSAGAEIITQHWNALKDQVTQLTVRLTQSMKREVLLKRRTLEALQGRLKSPKDQIRERIQKVDELAITLERVMSYYLTQKRSHLERLVVKLEALSPLKVLSRGYALVQDAEAGTVMRSSQTLNLGQRLNLKFYDGCASVKVESVQASHKATD